MLGLFSEVNRAEVLAGLIFSFNELHFRMIMSGACCEFTNQEDPVATS